MRVDVIETPDLGDRSYVVSDGAVAVVIDPQRDLDRVEALLERLGVVPKMVLETHLHNDYVTGGHALARRTGATYVVSGRDDVSFERLSAHGGDELSVGSMTVRVLDTPGHTDTHLTYVVSDRSGEPPAVFSGGSLLYGSVGRTDLLGDDRTDDLTREQWRSARMLAQVLPDDAAHVVADRVLGVVLAVLDQGLAPAGIHLHHLAVPDAGHVRRTGVRQGARARRRT